MNRKALGDIATFLSGGTPSRKSDAFWGGSIPWISGADINDRGNIVAQNFTTAAGVAGSAVNVVPAGTLLLVTRTSIGKSAVAPFELAFSQDITALFPNPDIVDSKYLRAFLDFYSPTLKAASRGATIQGVNRKDVEEIMVPLPEVDEQRRIAAILDEADELRTKRRQALAMLDELEFAFFEHSFGNAVDRNPDFEHLFLTEFCRPKQWPVISTKELTEFGYTVYGANGPIGFYDSFTHANPTIAITCRGATCGTINVTPRQTYINGNAMALDNLNTEVVTLEFLAAALRSRGLADVISGSAQPQITREGLSKVAISVPPLNEQLRFSEKITQLKSLRERFMVQVGVLDELFASLQDRAFKGEL